MFRLWVPSPLAGEGQDGGKMGRALLFTPSFLLPPQGQCREVKPECHCEPFGFAQDKLREAILVFCRDCFVAYRSSQ